MAKKIKEKDLFGTIEEPLKLVMPDRENYDRALTTLMYHYTKDRMVEIFDAFRKATDGRPLEVTGGDSSMASLKKLINASLNGKQKNKEYYARLLTVILGSKENFKLYIDTLPIVSRELFREIVLNCYMSLVDAKRKGKLKLSNSSYFYYSPKFAGNEFSWLEITSFDRYAYNDNDYYVYLPPSVYPYFLETLYPESFSNIMVYKELTGEYTITSFEKETFTDLPLITGMFSQGIVSVGTNKPLMASAEKKITQLGITDFAPKDGFANMRPHMLATYIASCQKDGYLAGDNVADEVMKMVRNRLSTPSDFFYICLPYMKGLKRSVSDYNNLNELIKYANNYIFTASKDRAWIDVKGLLVHAYSNVITSDRYNIIAYRPNRYNIGKEPENEIDGCFITPDEIVQEMSMPFLRGYLYFLASCGVLEIAEDKNATPDLETPYWQLAFVRLTALGEYAFGFSDTYKEPEEEKKVWFELDDERLIFRSLSDNNPYIVILKDVSNSIGGGRYEVTAESFLSHCSTRDDVEQKIDIFKRYIGRELPQLWKDFFAEMLRHCQPLEKLPVTNYKMYRVSKDNVALQRLLTTDEKLRSLVIRAEGYRILVAKADMAKFENRLKSFGYLL